MIDYLRVTWGVSGSDGQRLRKALNQAALNAEELEGVASTSAPVSDGILLEEILLTLEARDAELVTMSFVEGLSNREIAGRLNVTEARVSQLIARVLTRLREALGSD